MQTDTALFRPSQTQEEFIFSDSFVNALISSRGEGKTWACCVSLIIHAQRCRRDIRGAIIRDTLENIKSSTIPSIKEAIGDMVEFKDDFKRMLIHGDPSVEMHLMGIDDENSLQRLQGPEYAVVWLEEPAPMADKANAGLAESVFNAALIAAARQPGTLPRVQISMNPADEDHWTFKRLIEDDVIDPENPLITRQVWFIPYGENPHLTDIARQAVKAAYRYDKASYQRYVLGEFVPIYRGQKVAEDFNKATHVSSVPLAPAPGLTGFRAWDGWHNPVCLIGQITPSNRLVFLDCYRIRGDIRTLIQSTVMPALGTPRWQGKCFGWRDAGDFSMRIPDQSNRKENSARVIEQAFGTAFEPGPHLWANMKLGLGLALNHMIKGSPAIIVDPRLRDLIKALEGRWHYKTDMSGNVTQKGKFAIPFKNEASHVGDAFAVAVNVFLPLAYQRSNMAEIERFAAEARQRAEGYAVH